MPAVVGIYGYGARTGIETRNQQQHVPGSREKRAREANSQRRDGPRDGGGQWLAGKGRAATAAPGEVVKLSGSSSGGG